MDEMIEVVVSPDGKVRMEGVGFSGPSCEAVVRALSEAVGRVVSEERTSEFWLEEKAKVSQW